MSNALAVPTVTAALMAIVQEAVERLGLRPSPAVTPGPHGGAPGTTHVCVDLYSVDRRGGFSNTPPRDAAGEPPNGGAVALDLHYLVAFYGSTEWQVQQMVAATAAALHAEPLLTTQRLAAAADAHPEVVGNDLVDAGEQVGLTADALSLEDLARLWSRPGVGPFTLGLGVSAGPVLVAGG